MATSVTAKVAANVAATEVIDASANPGAGAQSIPHNAFDYKKSLSSTSTPPISLISEFELAAASGTIDLTSLFTTENPAKSASGLKLVVARFVNAGAHVFEVAIGAANGYAIGGNPIKAAPLGCAFQDFADMLTDVDGTHKTLDWTISGYVSGDKVKVTLLLG